MFSLNVMTLGALSLSASEKSGHVNELKFTGVLVRLDEPSTRPPGGSRGHRIILPSAVAKRKLDTLIGMGINYTEDFEGHDVKKKIGVITKAWIDGSDLKVSGIIWKKDFPDIENKLKSGRLGMSFEGHEIVVDDQHATVWTIQDLCFTGAAILYKTSAAYHKTEALAASRDRTVMFAELINKSKGEYRMNKVKKTSKRSADSGATFSQDQLASAFKAALKPLAAAISAQNASIANLAASFEEYQVGQIASNAVSAKVREPIHDDSSSSEGEGDDGASSSTEDEDLIQEETRANAKVRAAKKTMAKKGEASSSSEGEGASSSSEGEGASSSSEDEPVAKKKTTTKVKASASGTSKLVDTINSLVEERNQLQAKVEKLSAKSSRIEAQVAAAAASVDRKSVPHISPRLNGLLAKGAIDISALSDASEKVSVEEFDAILSKVPTLAPADRIALKAEAVHAGLLDEGIIRRN